MSFNMKNRELAIEIIRRQTTLSRFLAKRLTGLAAIVRKRREERQRKHAELAERQRINLEKLSKIMVKNPVRPPAPPKARARRHRYRELPERREPPEPTRGQMHTSHYYDPDTMEHRTIIRQDHDSSFPMLEDNSLTAFPTGAMDYSPYVSGSNFSPGAPIVTKTNAMKSELEKTQAEMELLQEELHRMREELDK